MEVNDAFNTSLLTHQKRSLFVSALNEPGSVNTPQIFQPRELSQGPTLTKLKCG